MAGISDLSNLGPTSAQWLAAVGVRTEADLRRVGPVRAYVMVKEAGFRPSWNLLWAMVAALEGMSWTEVPEDLKQRLKKQVADMV